MGKVIFKVLIGLGLLAYGALFLSWNTSPQEITGFQWMGSRYSQTLPVGSLVLVGLLAGALIMAVAAWSAWAAQRATAEKATAMVKKAKVKLQAQLDHIHELEAELDRAQAELESIKAGDGSWGRVDAADLASGAGSVVASSAETPMVEPEVDDPDVI